MSAFGANPYVYLFSIIVLVAVIAYFGFGVIDRAGLETTTAQAVVTGKQYTAAGKTYVTNVTGGRTWVQEQANPESYAVTLNVLVGDRGEETGEDGRRGDGDRKEEKNVEKSVGLVSREMYDSLEDGDRVTVRIRRTRITRKLQVVEVLNQAR